MARGGASPKNDLIHLASLFLWEVAIAAMAIAMYMKGDRPFTAFISSDPGTVFLLAIAALFISGAVVIHHYQASKRSSTRHFRLIVTMNLVTLVLILLTGEFVVRAGTRNFFEFEALAGNVVLMPKSWEATKDRYRQLLDQAQGYLTFIVHDSRKGWTVGPNRRGADGLYWSSAEGLRVPQEGMVVPKQTGRTDIAVVGDSFTFGEEVRYEETYAYYLNQRLGPEFRVLNFGVPGYGIDQMYLRYKEDVIEWKPKIVILGFISHDLERTLWVYPFLGNHAWNYPFSKPRFVLREGQLVNLNETSLPPETIFSKGAVSELPFIEYQKSYKERDWQKRFFHVSYLARLLTTWFPPWSPTNTEVSEEAHISVNASILRAFVTSVTQAGSIPVIVYFPRWEELQKPDVTISSWGEHVLEQGGIARRTLEQAGVAYVDATLCLSELDSSDVLYQSDRHHYSPEGNAAVAKCVHKAMDEILPSVKPPTNS